MQSTITPFTLSISNYKQVDEGGTAVVYYILEISKVDADRWQIEKRFKEFDSLNVTLKSTYANLPHFPAKTFFALKSPHDLEKRRQELEHYMQIIVTRTDIMSSETLKRFLELDNFAPETAATPPKLIADIHGLILGVRDFHYEIEEGLFFTALGDMSITSRMDSYLTNIKMPWDKDTPNSGLVTVGAVECYHQKGKPEDFKFEKLWIKTFQTQVINFYWDQASCLLVVGKDDGTITVLKVSSELSYNKYDEVVTNKIHHGRVMGVFIDSVSEFVYSVGEDKKFKVYDLRKNDLVANLSCGGSYLTALVPDITNKRIFISNRSGQAYVYDISSLVPKLLHIVQAHIRGSIRSMHFDPVRNYLLTANFDDGMLSIIDMQKPERIKYSTIRTILKGKKKVRAIAGCSVKGEIYAGSEDGSVTFWDAERMCPIYVLKAHTWGVTRVQYVPEFKVLITGGKDNRLRFYKLPEEWVDKRLGDSLLHVEPIKNSEIKSVKKNDLNQVQRAASLFEPSLLSTFDEPRPRSGSGTDDWAKGLS